MRAAPDSNTRKKRRVILTLSAEIVLQAESMTDNLSALVEQLLTEFIDRKHRERLIHSQAVAETATLWNKFGEGNGSFADEYSTV